MLTCAPDVDDQAKGRNALAAPPLPTLLVRCCSANHRALAASDPTVFELDDSIAITRVLFGVRHLNDRRAFRIQSLEQLHDLTALAGMQIARRLVREKELGLGNNGARHADELLLPTGELARVKVLLADHAEAIERVAHDCLTLRFLHVAVGKWNVEVLGDCEIVDQMVLLKDESDVLLVQSDTLLVWHRVHGMADEVELARPRAVEQSEDGEQRRLASARGTHDRDELAGLDVDGDAAQH